MTLPAGKTGVGPTVAVAVQQSFSAGQWILDHDLACTILPLSMRAFVMAAEKSALGIWGGIMCLKRYIGEKLIVRFDLVISAPVSTRSSRFRYANRRF